MKRFIFLIFFIPFAIFSQVENPAFDHVGTIDFANTQFIAQNSSKTTVYKLRSGRSIGKFISLNAESVLKTIFDMTNKSDEIIIVAESSNEKAVYTIDDFRNDVIPIPPAFVFDEIHNTTGDTVVVPELKGGKGELDMSFVDEELQAKIVENVHLQINKLSKAEVEMYFRGPSIIFPSDKSTRRWLANVEKIHIYRMK